MSLVCATSASPATGVVRQAAARVHRRQRPAAADDTVPDASYRLVRAPPVMKTPQRLQVIESYVARPNAPHAMVDQIRALGDDAFDHVCRRLPDLSPEKADRAELLLLRLVDRPCRARMRWLVDHGCELLLGDAEWRRVCGARAVSSCAWRVANAMPLRAGIARSEPIRAVAARGLALGLPAPWSAHLRRLLDARGAYWHSHVSDPIDLHVVDAAGQWCAHTAATADHVRTASVALAPGTGLAVVGSLGRTLTVACMARGCAIWFYDMDRELRATAPTNHDPGLLPPDLAAQVVDDYATYRRPSDLVTWVPVGEVDVRATPLVLERVASWLRAATGARIAAGVSAAETLQPHGASDAGMHDAMAETLMVRSTARKP